jgi:hypothetical protein
MARDFAQKPAKAAAPNPVRKSAYAEAMASRWALTDALTGGSEAMREAGKAFLPQHRNEDDDTYAARLARSFLLPVFAQTVEQLSDIVFSQPMTWDEQVPPDVAQLLEHVDAEGADIGAFAHAVLSAALQKGETYVIADEPPMVPPAEGKVITLADRRSQGVRPYLALIAADSMLAYETQVIGGVEVCLSARWRESERRQTPDFAEEVIERVIHWTPGQWRRFERIGKGAWVETEGELRFRRGGRPALPIVRFRLGRTDSAGTLLPPLHGLAEKNVEHWQSSSDQRAILTVSRFPMLGGSGVDTETLASGDDGKFIIGPNVSLLSRQTDSRFYYVEPGGQAIEAGVRDLERLEKDMAQLAYQPLMRQQAGVTATNDALGANKANSSLAAWALALGLALDRAVALLSEWQGREPPTTSFRPNTEFGIETLDGIRVSALQSMRSSGDLSRVAYLREMRVEGVLSDEFDIDANEAELEAEAAPAGALTGLDGGFE